MNKQLEEQMRSDWFTFEITFAKCTAFAKTNGHVYATAKRLKTDADHLEFKRWCEDNYDESDFISACELGADPAIFLLP